MAALDRGRVPKIAVTLMIAAALAGAARPAEANVLSDVGSGAAKVGAAAFDLAVLRPLNTGALAIGSVFFVASVPFVAPFEGVRTAWEVFVYAPFEYTFLREIGEF